MNTSTGAARDFEPIALAFAEEAARREGDTLARYLARYPQYAHELSVLAFETATSEGQPVASVPPPVALRARLLDDARAALSPAPEPAVGSLLARARAHGGLTPRALAAKLDVGVDVLALLEERHIAPDTVAAPFLDRLAALLGATAGAVRAYLAGPPLTAARGVAYHAPKGHTQARRISFDEAIAESNLTTSEQKAYWLAAATGSRREVGD